MVILNSMNDILQLFSIEKKVNKSTRCIYIYNKLHPDYILTLRTFA